MSNLPAGFNPAAAKPLRAVLGQRYTYSAPMLSTFALDGVPSGTVVVPCKGPGVGRAPSPWVYVADEAGKFLGMTTVHCLQRIKKASK